MTEEEKQEFVNRFIQRELELGELFDWIEAYAEEKIKEFAEFCHEHHKGCMLNAKDECEIVSLVEEYLKSKHKAK